jgi:competence protein ComEC
MAQGMMDRLAFRRAPLGAAALCFALGIAVEHGVGATHSVVELLGALALLAGLAVMALGLGPRTAMAAVAGVWVALGMAALEWQPSPAAPATLLRMADGLSRTVEARVVRVRAGTAVAEADTDPVPDWERTTDEHPSGRPVTLDLEVEAIEEVTPERSTMVPATGGVRVSVFQADGLSLACGDRLSLPLRMHPPQRYRDPGVYQYADYLLGEGIATEANARGGEVRSLGPGSATWRCRLAAAQGWASARLGGFVASAANRRLPRVARLEVADGAMLDAMLFGDRSGLSVARRIGFERTGTFHLFVVSGLHVALLAGGVFWVLGRMRVPAVAATGLTLAATAAYTALTGFGQPAQRALAMSAIYLLARLLSRNRDSMNALGAAVLALLVVSPRSLFETSFQMTALAIVAIAGIAVPLGRYTFLRYASVAGDVYRFPRAHAAWDEAQLRVMLELWGEVLADAFGARVLRLPAQAFRATLWVGELVLVGVVTELVMALPMAMYFHRAALFAVPANVVVIPAIGLLAPLAVATFVCSLVSPWLAAVPGSATAVLLHGVTWGIGLLNRLEAADVRVPGPAGWVGVVALLAWLGCCWLVRLGRRGAVATALVLPLVTAMVLWPESAVRQPGVLEVTAIDVGQGDSLLAVNPEGGTMLIDAGGPVGRGGQSEIVSNFDVGEEVVSPYLWSRRMRRVDVVVLSHAHTDHMGGMAAVVANFHPKELWVGADPDSALYRKLLAEAAMLGVGLRHVRAGDKVRWGSVDVSVLSPAAAYVNGGVPRNDDSVVLRLDCGKVSVLLEGDAEGPSEYAMLAAGLVRPVTLLKVAHHGSRTSTAQALVNAAQPLDAVISVGQRNTFGHPRAEVIERLAVEGAHVFRTDEFGLISFLLAPDGRVQEMVDGARLPAHGRP